MKVGPQVQGEFEFTNTGRDKLIIQDIHPSCGCTGVIAGSKKEFLPGETGQIKFTFNTEGRSGVNEKTLTITSNDVKNPVEIGSFYL